MKARDLVGMEVIGVEMNSAGGIEYLEIRRVSPAHDETFALVFESEVVAGVAAKIVRANWDNPRELEIEPLAKMACRRRGTSITLDKGWITRSAFLTARAND